VEFLKKLNHWIYQVERFVVVAALMVMSVVVFLAVVYRRYADPQSVLADKIAKLIGAERGTETWQSLQDIAGPIIGLALFVIIYLGFRTASRRSLWDRSDEVGKSPEQIHGEPLSHAKCAIYSVLTMGVGWGLMVVLFGTGKIEQYECIEQQLAGESSFACGMFPAGLTWAQPLGLVLTLWVAYLGASMATKENLHLRVEAVQHAMSEKLQRLTGLLSGVLTALFCLVLAYIGYRYVLVRYDEWVDTDGLGSLHDGLPIPYFASFLAVPIAYVLMAARFVGIGVLAFRGELEKMPAELRELEQQRAAEAKAGGEVQS
jgi:TRAP-type C4-dicarboxylate transport system permease small subunit